MVNTVHFCEFKNGYLEYHSNLKIYIPVVSQWSSLNWKEIHTAHPQNKYIQHNTWIKVMKNILIIYS